MDDDFIVIIETSKRGPAEEAFNDWLAEQRLRKEDIPDDDIRIDIGRDGDGGTFFRYLVRERWIER